MQYGFVTPIPTLNLLSYYASIVTELTRYIRTKKPGRQFADTEDSPFLTNDINLQASSEDLPNVMPRFGGGDLSFVNDQLSQKDMRGLANLFPDFLWLVRDFTLELSDEKGRAISAREYLEMTLQTAGDAQDSATAEVKSRLREYFIQRDCFTLVRPITNEKKLQHIGEVSQSELRIEFKNQVAELKELIFGNVKPKTQQGNMLNGRMFLSLCKTYCQALNEGGIIVDSCWDTVARTECESAFADARRFYKRTMKKYITQQGIISLEQLEKFHFEKKDESMKRFLENAVGDERTGYERELRKIMREEYHSLRDKLQKGSNLLCVRILNEIYMPIDRKVSGNEYASFAAFEQDINELVQSYSSNAKGSEKSNVLLNALLRWLFPNARQIHEGLLYKTCSQLEEQLQQQEQHYSGSIEQIQRQATEEKSNLNRKISDLEKSCDAFRSQCNEYKTTLWQREDILSSRDKEIYQLKKQLLAREEEIQELKQAADEHRHLAEEQISDLSKSNESLREDLLKAQENCAEQTKKMEHLEETIRRMELENESLSVETQHQQLNMEQLESKNSSLHASLETYEKEIKALKRKYETVCSSVQNLEETLIQTEQVLKQTQSERSILIAKNEDLGKKLNSVKCVNDNYESAIRKLEREVGAKDSRIRSYEKQIEREKDRAADNEERLRRSIKEKDRLLKSNREHQLELQVEKLNETNRRILQINKTVMEENRRVRSDLSIVAGSGVSLSLSSDLHRSLASLTKPIGSLSSALPRPDDDLSVYTPSHQVTSRPSTSPRRKIHQNNQQEEEKEMMEMPPPTPSLYEVEKMFSRARDKENIRPKARRGPLVKLASSPTVRTSDRYGNKENEIPI